MEASDHHEVVAALNALMREREQTRAALDYALKEFSTRLFAALERALGALVEAGVPGVGKYRRLPHPSGGREGFLMLIEEWNIILMPLQGFARPNLLDDARIPAAQFKEPCARIAVFLTDNPQASAFYDFLIFQDGSWFAWGYGWPKQQSDIESTDFESLAMDLVYSFIKDIYRTWHTRDETALAAALDAKRRCFFFGLPGEERQGG
ncbi:MAG: hypothetical protein AB1435_03865 [Chloroflexota bacterium]